MTDVLRDRTHRESQRLQVRQHLRSVEGSQPRHGLDLHEHGAFHEEIHLLAGDLPIPVLDQDRLFAFEAEASAVQLETVGALVDLLPEPGSERPVDGERAVHGLPHHPFLISR